MKSKWKKYVWMFVCVFGLFGAGCSSFGGWQRVESERNQVKGDGVTPESLDFTIYVAPGADILTADPVEVVYDLPGLDKRTLMARYTAESGSSEGVNGALIEQEEPGKVKVKPEEMKGRSHGSTVRLDRILYNPLTWLAPKEFWAQLQARMQGFRGVAFPLNKEGDKHSRTICFGLIEARNESEYQEHLAHCSGGPATRQAFREMYRDKVKPKGTEVASGFQQ